MGMGNHSSHFHSKIKRSLWGRAKAEQSKVPAAGLSSWPISAEHQPGVSSASSSCGGAARRDLVSWCFHIVQNSFWMGTRGLCVHLQGSRPYSEKNLFPPEWWGVYKTQIFQHLGRHGGDWECSSPRCSACSPKDTPTGILQCLKWEGCVCLRGHSHSN